MLKVRIEHPLRYTLHHKNRNTIFSVGEKPHVLSFHHKEDALFFGTLLEMKYRHSKEWPRISSIDKCSWDVSKIEISNRLSELFIEKWQTNEINEICMNNIIALVEVNSLSFDGTILKISGNTQVWEMTTSFYADIFEQRLKLMD